MNPGIPFQGSAGQTERLVNWIRSLEERRQQVTDALKGEGMAAEAVFLERGANGDTLVLYNAAEDLVAANKAFQESMNPVDVEFREMMMETLDLSGASLLEVLFAVP